MRAPSAIVLFGYSQQRHSNGDRDTVFFDTDIAATDSETIERFSHRWSIEITNRETKGLLGSADPQCRSEKSVTRAPLMAYCSYCLVAVWFADQFCMGKDLMIRTAPWYSKGDITFSDMLAGVILSPEFGAIPANTAKIRNSAHPALGDDLSLTEGQNYR